MNRTSIDEDFEHGENSVEYPHEQFSDEDGFTITDQNDSPLSPCYDNFLKEQHPFLQVPKIILENYLDPFYKNKTQIKAKDITFNENKFSKELLLGIQLSDFTTFCFSVVKKNSFLFGAIKTLNYLQYNKIINFENCVLTVDQKNNEIIKSILLHLQSFTKEKQSNNSQLFHIQKILDIIYKQDQSIKDEIYLQTIKQIINNYSSSLLFYLQFLAVYSTAFSPSKNFLKPIMNFFYFRKEQNSLHQTYCYFILNRIYRTYLIKNNTQFQFDNYQLTESDIKNVMLLKPICFNIQLYNFSKIQMEMQLDLTSNDILNYICQILQINNRDNLFLCLIKTTKKIKEIILKDDDFVFYIIKEHYSTLQKIKDIISYTEPEFIFSIKLIKIASPYQNIEIFTLTYLQVIQDYLNDFFPLNEEEIDQICALKLAADYGIKKHINKDHIDPQEYFPHFRSKSLDFNERIHNILSIYQNQQIISNRDARHKIVQLLDQYPRFLGISYKCQFIEKSQIQRGIIQKIILFITIRGLICSKINDQKEYICHIDYDLIMNFYKTNNKTICIQQIDKEIFLIFETCQEYQDIYHFLEQYHCQFQTYEYYYSHIQ